MKSSENENLEPQSNLYLKSDRHCLQLVLTTQRGCNFSRLTGEINREFRQKLRDQNLDEFKLNNNVNKL
jgi:hypothetical protein